MKKFLLILPLIFALSCKKEEKITLKTIMQTDENCNLIGNVDNEDWGLYNLSNTSERDDLIINHEAGLSNFFMSSEGIDVSDYNSSCSEDFNFNLLLCPNPFNINASDGQINYKLTHDLNIYKAAYVVVNRENQIAVSGGLNFSLTSGSFYPNFGRNFTLYYMVLTTDSCVFYGKGDVMIEN